MTVVIIGKRQDVAGPTHVSHRAERRWRLGDPVDVSLPIDLNARANAHGALRGPGLVIQRKAEVGRSVKVGGPVAAVRTKWLAEHGGHERQSQKSHVPSVRRIWTYIRTVWPVRGPVMRAPWKVTVGRRRPSIRT